MKIKTILFSLLCMVAYSALAQSSDTVSFASSRKQVMPKNIIKWSPLAMIEPLSSTLMFSWEYFYDAKKSFNIDFGYIYNNRASNTEVERRVDANQPNINVKAEWRSYSQRSSNRYIALQLKFKNVNWSQRIDVCDEWSNTGGVPVCTGGWKEERYRIHRMNVGVLFKQGWNFSLGGNFYADLYWGIGMKYIMNKNVNVPFTLNSPDGFFDDEDIFGSLDPTNNFKVIVLDPSFGCRLGLGF